VLDLCATLESRARPGDRLVARAARLAVGELLNDWRLASQRDAQLPALARQLRQRLAGSDAPREG
jgi:hypothetical protein